MKGPCQSNLIIAQILKKLLSEAAELDSPTAWPAGQHVHERARLQRVRRRVRAGSGGGPGVGGCAGGLGRLPGYDGRAGRCDCRWGSAGAGSGCAGHQA